MSNLDIRKMIDLWENNEKKNQINMMIDGENLILFFLHNKELYGAQEPSRVTLAKMIHPDDEDPEGWIDDANFMAINLSRAVVGQPTQHMFKAVDVPNIKIVDDKDKVVQALLSISDNVPLKKISSSVRTLKVNKSIDKDDDDKQEMHVKLGNSFDPNKKTKISQNIEMPSTLGSGSSNDMTQTDFPAGASDVSYPGMERELHSYKLTLDKELYGLLEKASNIADSAIEMYQNGEIPNDNDKAFKAEFDIVMRTMQMFKYGFTPRIQTKEPVYPQMGDGPELFAKTKKHYVKLKKDGLMERYYDALAKKEEELKQKYAQFIKDFENKYGSRQSPWD